jgi:hypothetical protein
LIDSSITHSVPEVHRIEEENEEKEVEELRTLTVTEGIHLESFAETLTANTSAFDLNEGNLPPVDTTTNQIPSNEATPKSEFWWLDIDAVDSFKTYSLPHSTFKKWAKLSLMEKLPYLIDRSYLVGIKDTFGILCSMQSGEAIPVLKDKTIATLTKCAKEGIKLETFITVLEEFITKKQIESFYKDCDTLHNLKADDRITWVEYVVCRGYYDAHASPHDVSEFDFLENIVILDYQNILNDPHNPLVLDLIARNEL